jgi:hypothetical protein
MAVVPPVPVRSPVVETISGVLHRELVRFLNTLREWLGNTSQQVGTVELEAQGAAIVTTNVPTATLQTGLYRASYSLRITQAATVSSSATLTLGWTSNSVSCSQSFTAVTGNTTATQQSGSITINVDTATSVTYAVAFASVGATSMQYALDVRLEELP